MRANDIPVPAGWKITSVEKSSIAETNQAFICKGTCDGSRISFFVKISKRPGTTLTHERAVLASLNQIQDIPSPKVLWYGKDRREFLSLEFLRGAMLWDFLDPKRRFYNPEKILPYIGRYGGMLGRIHELPGEWPQQQRRNLYNLIGEEELEDREFREIIDWLAANRPSDMDEVFTHGDLNSANVLFYQDEISGVVDWEFAGIGWREYDLAWVLRRRLNYMNSEEERAAFLEGYRSVSTYDPGMLRWCETLNYLHIAYWTIEREAEYGRFALSLARDTIEGVFGKS